MERSPHLSLGIDVMGAALSPQEIYRAAISSLNKNSSAKITLYAEKNSLDIKKDPSYENLKIVFCEQFVSSQDFPRKAFRSKRNATIFKGLEDLKKGDFDSFITASNTGALLLGSSFILDKFPGIRRPALLTHIPTSKGEAILTDAGANLHLDPFSLHACAVMASKYFMVSSKNKGRIPQVGLLNIGTEFNKGTTNLKEAYKLLAQDTSFHFVGNVESGDVLLGKADIIIAEGFTGNIFLKTIEAAYHFFFHKMDLLAQMQMSALKQGIVPYAVVAGTPQRTIKCHGSSTFEMFEDAILKELNYLAQRA